MNRPNVLTKDPRITRVDPKSILPHIFKSCLSCPVGVRASNSLVQTLIYELLYIDENAVARNAESPMVTRIGSKREWIKDSLCRASAKMSFQAELKSKGFFLRVSTHAGQTCAANWQVLGSCQSDSIDLRHKIKSCAFQSTYISRLYSEWFQIKHLNVNSDRQFVWYFYQCEMLTACFSACQIYVLLWLCFTLDVSF